jgi:hypothetical protein
MKYFLIVLLVLSLTACFPMSDEIATRALKAQGMTDITFDGMAIFGCGENDIFRKKFTAKSTSGVVTSGVVCGGVFKGATVRID